MTIFKRIGAILAIALLGATVAAAPAQATIINGCDDGGGPPGSASAVCLYNWVDWNKGGGFWRRSFSQMAAYTRNCASLENHYWDIGGVIYDEPPSSIVAHQNGGQNKVIRMYDWVNCNYAGGYVDFFVPVGSISQDNNLSTTVASNNGIPNYNTNWYNRASSIQLCAFTNGNVVCD